jgi:The GLUG motif
MKKLSAKIKHPLWVAGLNIALALTVGSTQAFANGGNYNIANKEDLVAIGELEGTPLSANYVVTESFSVDAAIGSTYVAGIFTGTFDGGGFTISGLTKPLFEVIDGNESSPTTTISDLTLVAAAGGVIGGAILAEQVSIGTVIDNVDVRGNVIGGFSVGGLVGFNVGTISNSSATGDVEGFAGVGGLVGASEGTITNSYATGDVTGLGGYIGGLVGSSSGTITDSYATGAVNGSGEYIGGLVGWLEVGATISNSYATGVVAGTGTDEGDHGIGGLVGYSSGDISDSHAAGNVNGFAQVGGLVGSTGIATNITNSYASGTVTGIGNDVGGLVGSSSGTITNSYATGDVDGDENNAGGLVGINDGEISDSYAIGTVTGNYSVGGLVGRNDNGTINENSYAAGFVTGFMYVGGLVGYNTGEILNSYATGAVTGVDNGEDVGGLVGWNFEGDISNSYATGAVTGDYDLGGLVGWNFEGDISNSYAIGTVTGDDNNIGGLVGINEDGNISNSYATGAVTGVNDIGGLVGENDGDISNSYATGAVTGNGVVGGLVGWNGRAITDSYANGAVNGVVLVGGLVGEDGGTITDSNATGAVNNEPSGVPPLSPTELLNILNTGSEPESPIFALASNLNNGRPHLLSNPPLADEAVAVSARVKSSYLLTQALDVLKKSVGFTVAKSDLSKLDLALLDQVKDGKSAPIIGGKLFSYQSLSTSLSVGSILQLEINFEANKSLQMWVKSSEGQYVLVGDVSLDKDGNAILPGIEFKKSGQYELIFVNSDKRDLAQPELMNKVIGLTVYVN